MNVNPPAENFIVLPRMRVKTSDSKDPPERRLRGISWMPNSVRHHFIALIGEFVGTFLFLFFAFSGAQVANESATAAAAAVATVPNAGILLYISLVFGFSLLVNAWVFFRITGGLFNPAVSE
jgi:aquaporin rerated protein, other eukaryote